MALGIAGAYGIMRTSDELIGHIIADYLPERFAEYALVGTATDYASTTDCNFIANDGHVYRVHVAVILARWPKAPVEEADTIRVDLSRNVAALLIDYCYGRSLVFPTIAETMELFLFAKKNGLRVIVDENSETAIALLTPKNFLQAYDSTLKGFFHLVHSYATYHIVDSYHTYPEVRNEFCNLSLIHASFLLGDNILKTPNEVTVLEMIKTWMTVNDSINSETLEVFNRVIHYNKRNSQEINEPMAQFLVKHNLSPCEKLRSRRRLPRDALVFFGLYNNKNPLTYWVDIERKAINRFPFLDCLQFMQVPHFTAVNGTLAQVGGSTDAAIGFARADCFRFDTKMLVWRRFSSLPFERAHPAICSSPDGSIYHIGGHSQLPRKKLKHAEIYTPSLNTWKSLPKMNDGRYKAAAVYCRGKLVVCGGMNEDAALASVEVLPRFSTHWTMMTAMSVPRAGHKMVLYDDSIYVLGGKNLGGEMKTVERIRQDFVGTWRHVPDMTVTRVNFAAEVYDNKIFVFGGEHPIADGRPLTVEFFDGKNWNPFCTLPPDVYPLSALAFYNLPSAEVMFCKVSEQEILAARSLLPRKRAFRAIST